MNNNEKDALRRGLEKQFNEYFNPEELKRYRHKPTACTSSGITVRIVVREKRLAPDVMFTHESDSMSELQAELEAKKEAKDEGYHVFGHVYDVKKR